MMSLRKAAWQWLLGCAFALAGWGVSAPVHAQESPSATAALPSDVAQVIEHGAQLEQQRRWAEALTYYERALRQHPGQVDLEQRVALTRAHYDIVRRYSDSSFTGSITTLTDRDCLAVYDEILTKVQTYYVHDPRWKQMVRYGAMNIEVALSEPSFVQRCASSLSAEQQANLVRSLKQWTDLTPVENRAQAVDLVDRIARTVKQHFGMSSQAVILEFVAGAVSSLDEYSSFLTGTQMSELFSQIEGNFVGLGVELKTEDAGLLIVNIIPGGPADKGGLKISDRIMEVDGRRIGQVSPDGLADMLRGAEGSQVRVVSRDAQGRSQHLTLTRERIEVPSVENVKIVDAANGVGYFKLSSFQKTTNRDVDAALWKLHEQGMRSLIIDLRGNPGGLLKAAVDVSDKFINEGLIVATRGRSPREDFDHKGQLAGTWRVPLVVLIDHDSASASEIFAGAIRDHHRGTVVGEKSYGKGSVQGIFPLASAEVGVRITTAKWYTPSGQAISGHGVSPDVTVRTAAKPVNGAIASEVTDPVLNSALQVFRNQTAQAMRQP
jgi:carboxyl-terminal processing protease